jgi:hypothetical protein
MRRRSELLLISLWLLALAGLVPQAAMSEPAARNLTVRLSDYRVLPSVASIAAGRVTFVVHNTDTVPHNFVVLRTSIPARSLPVSGGHGRAREVGRQGGTPFFYAEQTRRLTLSLRPSRYLLICNVPGHYQKGMVAAFRVRQ